ncbi:MAG: DUF2917 domain-containing protein [Ottowia sp.]|uniref:DUF2917 domain-containing protein n=1 Tax=Ottowia sp. TaxID=1898956 RepID=UPI0039E4C2B9
MPHPESTLSRLAPEAATRGLWTLSPARALTLRPRRDGVLHLARGAAWATRAGPHAGTAEGGPQGDLLLAPGTRLPLRAGDTLVLEPIAAHGEPARAIAFDWRETTAPHAAPAWHEAVARPAHDLARALAEATHAFARLARGVLRWSGGRLIRRPFADPLHLQ